MNKLYRILLLTILGFSLICSGAAWSATDLNPPLGGDNDFQNDALDLAGEYYQRSGLEAYHQTSSMLWTENLKRRSDLQKKLPPIDQGLVRKFRAELATALNQAPKDTDAYILAGRYQLFKGQYDGALWNFQQALSVKTDSVDARIALADYYLVRWQPDQVIALLDGIKTPESSFRLGEAYIQKNDSFSALGYLLQAEPLSGELKATRNKDIAKAFLSIGEVDLAKQFNRENFRMPIDNPVRITLANELQGWIAWLEGNILQANSAWTQGKAANSDYLLWDGLKGWLHPTVLQTDPVSGYTPAPKGDSDLISQLNIGRGFDMIHDKKNDAAYSFFLAGIKADHRSLIGFWGAARSQFLNKKYLSAANLCSQGLAVNSNFRPLLELKLDVDAKLENKENVLKDRELLRKVDTESGSVKFFGTLDQTPNGKPFLLLRGETKSLYGVWISSDGLDWQFQPWWGGPVYLKKAYSQLWVLPCGKDASGEVLLVRKTLTSGNPAVEKPIITLDNGFTVTFSTKVEAIAAFISDGQLSGSYFSENSTPKHWIPFSNVGWDSKEMAVWFRNANRRIGAARFKITAPRQVGFFKYHLYPEKPVTNRRNIRLKLTWENDSAIADKMTVSEGSPTEPAVWRNVESEIPFTVSEGDGVKEITVKLSDRHGNTAEIKTSVLLDTALPRIFDAKVIKQESECYRLQWTTSKPCSAWIEFLSSEGVWRETPAISDGEQSFSGVVPLEISYCAIILTDQAGKRNETPFASLNTQLQNGQSVKFMINDGTGFVNSRNVEIKPVGDALSGWNVSNDLKTWSPVVQESNFLRWRLGPGEGEKRVFIKVYRGKERQTYKIITMPIFLDMTPPIIRKLEINQYNDGYVIKAEFSEPVCKYTVGSVSIKEPTYLANQVWDIKSSEFPMKEGIKISVRDRAGNMAEFQPDFSTAVATTSKN